VHRAQPPAEPAPLAPVAAPHRFIGVRLVTLAETRPRPSATTEPQPHAP
jgi:hypothetical protein